MKNNCKHCRFMKELHFRNAKGELDNIKYICGNRFGISDFSPVIPDSDFCSRFKEKEWPAVKIGDEVIVDGVKGIIVREPYQIGNPDDPLIMVLVWYGHSMGGAKLRKVQPTGKTYPEVEQIIEQLEI